MFRILIAVSLVGLWSAAFLIAAAEAGAAQVTEDADPIELNPSDYVPLEVGNRWTYKHVYSNALHGAECIQQPAKSQTRRVKQGIRRPSSGILGGIKQGRE